MAVYNLFDVLTRVTELINDEYVFADISEIPADDEFPASLEFLAVKEDCSVDYGNVDALPLDYDFSQGIPISDDMSCYSLTLSEATTVLHALDNALEYFKECSSNKSGFYDRATLESIKSSAVRCRNLQAKMKKFLKNFK